MKSFYKDLLIKFSISFFILLLQVNAPKEVLNEWQERPQILVARYIRKILAQKGQLKSLFGHQGSIKSPRRFKLVQQESQAHE